MSIMSVTLSRLRISQWSLLYRLQGSNLTQRIPQKLTCVTTTSNAINWKSNDFIGFLMYSTHPKHNPGGVFENQPRSWLFVSDSIAGAYGSHVNLNLDLKFRLAGEQLQKLLSNIQARKLEIDVNQLLEDFATLQEMELKRKAIEERRQKLAAYLSELKSQPKKETTDSEFMELKAKLKGIKQEGVDAQQELWPVEEKVMHAALKLPNNLHSTTPLKEDFVVIKEKKGEKAIDDSPKSHVEIGKKYGLIKFSNVGPKAYYLHGELAQAEMAMSNTLVESVQEQGYRLMAGPEFFKTPILEGCGRDVYDTKEVLTMHHFSYDVEPMNHLAGVSPMTFVGYLARTCIGDNIIPFRMMSCGRTYQTSDLPGLFGAAQSTQVSVFSTTRESDVDLEFDAMFNLIWSHLESLGFSLRARQLGASKLRPEENRRVNIEMYSPGLDQYIPVAHVSDLGDYVSRRLMISHNLNHGDYRQASIAHMVSGTVLNITSFLAIWMEHSDTTQDKFSLCSVNGMQSK